MYRVLIADDEAASLNHLCNIIKTKCENFTVMDTAGNGKAALLKIQDRQPDIIFTDVLMPLMNGIELVSEVKRMYPDILSVVVSGYNDFAYVKGAIRSGVCEYILKPVRPSDVVKLMENLRVRLDEQYYERRMSFLKKLSRGMEDMDEKELERLFPDEKYYAAIYRKNGLSARFSRNYSVDLYSMPQEKIIIYGRDEMEALYLCPGRLLDGESFEQYFERVYGKVQEENAFYTAVVKEEAFEPKQLPIILKQLYRRLDESIVIGKTQMVPLDAPEQKAGSAGHSYSFEMLEYYVRRKETKEIQKEIMRLFKAWEQECCPQIWLEEKIHFLLTYFFEKRYIGEFSEFVLDDTFAEAVSMEELARDITRFIVPESGQELVLDKWEEEYREILWYLEEHLEENITVWAVCRQFAISQTVLSKIFHKYGDCSFSNYLTRTRMEKAKKIMQENPGVLVRDVAERVGYGDQFYFSRMFRSTFGISPSEYMEQQVRESI